MPIIKKPDHIIFASEAKKGELSDFPNLLRGWGVTIDQTAGKPPMEWFNTLQKRTDEWLTYLSQRGISEWDNTLDYPKNAVVQSGGKFYVSIKENIEQKPDKSQNYWQEMVTFLGISKSIEDLRKEIEKKLTKDQNGADIPDKNQFIKNLGLTETVDCAKNALDKRTGGTVNGDIISQGGQITLKGDGRQHFMFQDKDGTRRMWLYKDKGGDGVRLNNGEEGVVGDYVFHKDGGFRAPSSVYAGAARMAADGNIYGSMWGNQWLDAYLRNTFQPKGAYSKPNTAKREVNGWWKCGDTGLIIQWARYGKDKGSGTYDFPLPMKFPKVGLFCLGYVSTAVSFDTDRLSHSAHLVDNATVRVTIDYGLEAVVLAIGF